MFVTVVNVNTTAIKRIDVISVLVDTTIEGFVQLPDQTPVQSAEVTLAEFDGQATTDATGHFAMATTVAVEASLRLAIAAQVEGQAYSGSVHGLSVFADGITDAGIIALVPSFTGDIPDILFDNPEYTVGRRPRSVYLGDLNGDGTLDAVTANQLDNNVSVLLNAGGAIFAEAVHYDVASTPVNVAIVDLDGDGDLDLAVASGSCCSSAPGFVTVLLNNGNGTFANNPSQYPTAQGAIAIVAGDLDGDNDVDLATCNRAGSANIGTISVLINNGDGTFAEQIPFSVGDEPQSLAIGDLDGDNDLDLAAGILFDKTVEVLINGGNGFFTAGPIIDLAEFPAGVVIGDLGGSGDADLVVLTKNGSLPGHVSLFIGDGKLGFADPVIMTVGPVPNTLRQVDVDNDGDLDLAVSNSNGGNGDVSILFKNEDGTFSNEVRIGVGAAPNGIAFGDLDGDERIDLASANASSAGRVAFVRNNGGGSFGPARFPTGMTRGSSGCSDHKLAIGDWNGDGLLDAVAASCGDSRVAVMIRNADGSFADRVDYDVAGNANDVTSGDFDGDGNLDLAVAGSSGRVSILLNNKGDGTFARAADLTVTNSARSIAAGHLNDDGFLDLATASLPSGAAGVSVLFGNGDGTFDEALSIPVSSSWLVAIADADGDQVNDLMVGRLGTPDLVVLLNNGDGTFRAPLESNAPLTFSTVMAVGDLNGNGILDVVFAGSNRNVSVLFGLGLGNFADEVVYELTRENHGTNSVVIGDLDGDGIADIAAGNRDTHSVTVLLGQVDGTFVVDSFYSAGLNPSGLAIGDVENDGDLDLVIHGNPNGNMGVSTLLNRSIP